ncbi:uncharacterized protein A4U43_C09F270 [Asparagus officinalis]|uniref:Secreted protein n=1 Tax=Asparagus officinalis TaxID=4686 RepID=A0A5P1E455_ASPOF|nr:uncharacterized protein A4U43_C09F270 [Asparagus officinalis]
MLMLLLLSALIPIVPSLLPLRYANTREPANSPRENTKAAGRWHSRNNKAQEMATAGMRLLYERAEEEGKREGVQ